MKPLPWRVGQWEKGQQPGSPGSRRLSALACPRSHKAKKKVSSTKETVKEPKRRWASLSAKSAPVKWKQTKVQTKGGGEQRENRPKWLTTNLKICRKWRN